MNYYEHHLGDWAAATGHLTWDEDMAYTRLLRAYYHQEQPIPQGQQYRLAKASTPSQRKAVDQVLNEFFELRDGRFHQRRADKEIARFQDKQNKARRSANARWSASPTHSERNANASPPDDANAMRTHCEGNALQTPDTIHQRSNTPPLTPPGGVDDDDCPPLPPPENPPKRAAVHEFPPGFDRFWQAYPRKTAKPHAAKAFARLRPDEALLERMLQALQAQRSSPQWQRDGGQFIPHPATWLNGRRWEDQLPLATGTDDAFAGAL